MTTYNQSTKQVILCTKVLTQALISGSWENKQSVYFQSSSHVLFSFFFFLLFLFAHGSYSHRTIGTQDLFPIWKSQVIKRQIKELDLLILSFTDGTKPKRTWNRMIKSTDNVIGVIHEVCSLSRIGQKKARKDDYGECNLYR